MKKLLFLALIATIFTTGCEPTTISNTTDENSISLPNHNVYYIKYNFTANTSEVIKTNVKTLKEESILNSDFTIDKIRVTDKVYCIFNNRVGYITDNKVKYITSENDYVIRYTVKGNNIYYGKDNSNASDDIFEKFAMIDINSNNNNVINEMGIGQLLVDDYIFFKPNSGTDVNKLLKYDLDGSNMTVIYDKPMGYLVNGESYLFFINYSDNNSLYRIKKDGTDILKLAEGPINFNIFTSNQYNGYYYMATIDDTLYYINTLDNNKLYKIENTNSTKISDSSFSSIKIFDKYLYATYNDSTKLGIYLLDINGKELKKISNTLVNDYDIN